MDICGNLFCDKEANFTCARCNSMKYCSPLCQKNHWSFHKKNCYKNLIQNESADISLKRRQCIEEGVDYSNIDKKQNSLLRKNLKIAIENSSSEPSLPDKIELTSAEYIDKFTALRTQTQHFLNMMEDNISILASTNKEEQEKKIKCESIMDQLDRDKKKDTLFWIEGKRHLEKINSVIDETNKQILTFTEMKENSTIFLLDIYKTFRGCCKCGRFDSKDNINQFCSNCKIAKYCSRECQRGDWENHKKDCKKL